MKLEYFLMSSPCLSFMIAGLKWIFKSCNSAAPAVFHLASAWKVLSLLAWCALNLRGLLTGHGEEGGGPYVLFNFVSILPLDVFWLGNLNLSRGSMYRDTAVILLLVFWLLSVISYWLLLSSVVWCFPIVLSISFLLSFICSFLKIKVFIVAFCYFGSILHTDFDSQITLDLVGEKCLSELLCNRSISVVKIWTVKIYVKHTFLKQFWTKHSTTQMQDENGVSIPPKVVIIKVVNVT